MSTTLNFPGSTPAIGAQAWKPVTLSRATGAVKTTGGALLCSWFPVYWDTPGNVWLQVP